MSRLDFPFQILLPACWGASAIRDSSVRVIVACVVVWLGRCDGTFQEPDDREWNAVKRMEIAVWCGLVSSQTFPSLWWGVARLTADRAFASSSPRSHGTVYLHSIEYDCPGLLLLPPNRMSLNVGISIVVLHENCSIGPSKRFSPSWRPDGVAGSMAELLDGDNSDDSSIANRSNGRPWSAHTRGLYRSCVVDWA